MRSGDDRTLPVDASSPAGVIGSPASDDESGLLRRLREAEAPVRLGVEAGFELLEEIGRGGQGVVYRARDPASGRSVAIKRLYLSIEEQRDASVRDHVMRRLRREVAIAGTLCDERIAAAERVVEENGRLYAVMPLVEGVRADRWASRRRSIENVSETRELAREGPPDRCRSAREVVDLMRSASRAVARAHASGIVHRDLKPSNILVRSDGSPVIVDFGLARRSPMDGAASQSQSLASLTGGEFAGTIAYAAPEVLFDQRPPDQRSDVYALGAAMYELLTGVTPHAKGTSLASMIMDRARSRAVPAPAPSAASGASERGVDDRLDAIVRRAMSEDPSARHRDAGELADELDGWAAGESTPRSRSESVEVHAWPGACPIVASNPDRRGFAAPARAAIGIGAICVAVAAGWGVWTLEIGRGLDAARGAVDGDRASSVPDAQVIRTLAAMRAAGIERFELGERDQADRFFRAAMDMTRSTPNLPPLEVHDTLRVCSATSRYPHEFRSLSEEALRLESRVSRESSVEPGLMESIRALAGTLRLKSGEFDAALVLFMRNDAEPEAPFDGLKVEAWLESRLGESDVYSQRGEYARAADTLRRALDACERWGRSRHASAAYVSSRLGLEMVRNARPDDGLPMLRRACELHRTLVPEDHPDLAVTDGNLGIGLLESGAASDAIVPLRAAFLRASRSLGFDHPHSLKLAAYLALARLEAGDVSTPRDGSEETDDAEADPAALAARVERMWTLIGWRSDESLRTRLRSAIAVDRKLRSG